MPAASFTAALAGVALLVASDGLAVVDEPIYIIDTPTAGLLAHGEYHIQGRIGQESSVLLAFRVGIKGVMHLGVAYGMQRVFERADVEFNDRVGLLVRVRLIQEGEGPALALGFNSQGEGTWDESQERYERKSLGFYGVLSKNWKVVGTQFSLHGGANWSTETTDEKSADIFAGVDWEPIHHFSLLMDWNAGLNDKDQDGMYGGGRTYLDAAAKLTYGENLSMMLIFRDLTGNYEPNPHVWREFEIAYQNTF
jgi:hypothetical protein